MCISAFVFQESSGALGANVARLGGIKKLSRLSLSVGCWSQGGVPQEGPLWKVTRREEGKAKQDLGSLLGCSQSVSQPTLRSRGSPGF